MSLSRITREVIRQTRLLSIRRLSTTAAAVFRLRFIDADRVQRNFSVFSKSPDYSQVPLLDLEKYEAISSETMESLTDYFEEIVEADPKLKNADIEHSDGVLTVKLGNPYGTYVINRQTPNRQIWLSSPTSGPKRYDFIGDNWIYKHDGMSMHQLLQNELSKILSVDVDFLKLAEKNK